MWESKLHIIIPWNFSTFQHILFDEALKLCFSDHWFIGFEHQLDNQIGHPLSPLFGPIWRHVSPSRSGTFVARVPVLFWQGKKISNGAVFKTLVGWWEKRGLFIGCEGSSISVRGLWLYINWWELYGSYMEIYIYIYNYIFLILYIYTYAQRLGSAQALQRIYVPFTNKWCCKLP